MIFTAADVETIARALLGEPNQAQSTKAELRYGEHGALAIQLKGKKAGSWYDHAQGKGGGPIDLIRREKGLDVGGAFDWLRSVGIKVPERDNGQQRRVVAEYVYATVDGAPLFKVSKWNTGVRFTQKRYDAPTGKFVGGKGCMTGIDRVPYHLDDLVKSPGLILIAEGEKDTDNLRQLGFQATCNAGGAGKWRKEFFGYFKADQHVVILPDNDDPGRRHATVVARSLLSLPGAVASVQVLELPDLPAKGDASDWIAAGGTADQLRALIETAPQAQAWLAQQPEEPKPDAKAAPPDDWEAPLLEAIEELNEKHFVVVVGGQTVIATLDFDEPLKRDIIVFSQERDIRLRYKNRHYLVGHTQKDNEIWQPLGDAWLEHPKRRTYDRLALIPTGPCPEGTFNLWRGFGVEPKPGAWSLIKAHLLEVICSGDEPSYQWLIRWLARAVQCPALRAEVAVVLRGKKGAGKGAVGQLLIALFRHHALPINNSAHLTGRFNGHLVDVLFLFVDEAFWAGDKAGEATLKALVTEPTIPIEPKYVTLFQTVNRLKILMSSNSDWVVPATADERRYFVLDVPDSRLGDHRYFNKLYNAIEGAELPAFLHDMLALDLADFNFRYPPHTAALNRQKLRSADSIQTFWHDCLLAGMIIGVEDTDWPLTIVTQALFGAYVRHAHDHGDRHPLSDAIVIKKLAELLPNGLHHYRPRLKSGDRPPSYKLPPLEECRAAFLAAMNINDGGQGGTWWDEDPWPAGSRGNPGLVSEDSEDSPFSESLYYEIDITTHGQATHNTPYPSRKSTDKGDHPDHPGHERAPAPSSRSGIGGGTQTTLAKCDVCGHPACLTGPNGNWCANHIEPWQRS